ncbi:MAG: hypothetical protein KME26_11115 [Oscillatoria princeps RMCB-10]|jgi:hypothetical protein|nr:hypothetical protein [Oscillatoria princeps RMCB-10]
MVKNITLLLVLALSFSFALPAEASFCRHSNDHLICVLSIKRSAKNYWEYRAAVSVDGEKRPIEIYNCRQRVRVRKDGTAVPFQPKGAGELICSALKK